MYQIIVWLLILFQCLDGATLLKTHVQGVINHGLKDFVAFVDINEYQHDSNFVMNVLLKAIYEASITLVS